MNKHLNEIEQNDEVDCSIMENFLQFIIWLKETHCEIHDMYAFMVEIIINPIHAGIYFWFCQNYSCVFVVQGGATLRGVLDFSNMKDYILSKWNSNKTTWFFFF